ncbi:uncharacterized protein TRIVIDRAFT_63289 [Trichoderma virens Gv29-8]|uniref:Uncharacterized protein n=1 Tax=Hypocrea virens (strain Gv29-8 / FGSC 10586) TaxID=413071 RepID=G9MGV9_HYPVG|nr:uncharacterized protein TRIVIDRAFT_63289 [Trichoderma virens Gv29-8]EHK25954.1 hypothetical protein TRIVIDRAFT_63289 [Trichoderma virens Gv29-8]UKZ46129.1 hypothetical protein TrVGV298_000327 [Trichoderma virens]
MFVGGYFIRLTTPLWNPFTLTSIFSRSPPPSFPFIRSSLAAIADFFRDAIAIFQFFWPLFLLGFCINIFAAFVQPYIFSVFAFAFRAFAHGMGRVIQPLRDLVMPAIRPAIQWLPTNWIPLNKGKKKAGGRPRSLSDKSGKLR